MAGSSDSLKIQGAAAPPSVLQLTQVQHHTMNKLQRHTIEQTVRDLQEIHAWTTEDRPWHSDITAENREQTRAYKMGYIRGIADMLSERLEHMLRMEQSERELLEELAVSETYQGA